MTVRGTPDEDEENAHQSARGSSEDDEKCKLPLLGGGRDGNSGTGRWMGMSLKWLSLALLTLQTTAQALLIRWSKAKRSEEGPAYLDSAAVVMVELVKLMASLVLVAMEYGGVAPAAKALEDQFSQGWAGVWEVAVPSVLYTVLNNLMFYSLEKLSAPIQQVLWQMKIIITAGLGLAMLGKSLTNTKWCACFLLAIGIAMVQWPRESQKQSVGSDQVKGFFAVTAACFCSGFASVWIQKMLQEPNSSIWVRNVQLALFGCLNGLIVVVLRDTAAVYEQGFFGGFDHRVISAILITALGGLLCAMMLKYAGATLGCFSTAISIVLTAFLSEYLLRDFTPDLLFYCGTFVAIGSTFLFTVGLPDFLTRLVPM